MGEDHFDLLDQTISAALEYYSDKLNTHLVPALLNTELETDDRDGTQLLNYPGKLSWNTTGKLLAVSNTGNHNIVIADEEGVVQVNYSDFY